MLTRFRENGSAVLVYLRDGAAGVPLATGGGGAMRMKAWREVGVGAQIPRDLGISTIRNLSRARVPFVGLAGLGITILALEPPFGDPP